ncbi:site-2 protease family protein, partial [Patescibacteria group bacterium]|nr:site-2 protease family protein [Patescibacteria group bacterium]
MAIAIAVLSIFILVILHELGHFLFAKKFGIKVEEFGIGIPPRIAGKQWGETMYSLNLLPLGAFVKMKGEQSSDTSPRSFGSKPVWQRIVIVLGGVASSWLVAIILFTVLVGTVGIPTAISDEEEENVRRSQVFISQVAPNSPAEQAGLMAGDVVLGFGTMSQLQEFVELRRGEEIQFSIQRLGESEPINISVTPRVDVPEGEGATGIALLRIGFLVSPWYKAPIQGTVITGRITLQIFDGFGRLISGQEQISIDQFRGPIGIVNILQ